MIPIFMPFSFFNLSAMVIGTSSGSTFTGLFPDTTPTGLRPNVPLQVLKPDERAVAVEAESGAKDVAS